MYYYRGDKIAFINDKWVFGVSAYISNDVTHTKTNVHSFLLLNLLHEPTHVAISEIFILLFIKDALN